MNLTANCFPLNKINPKLKLLTLDCPYSSIENPLTKKMFSNIFEFKIVSYLKEHRYGALPLDTSDYIASHLLLVEDLGYDYKILMGFKIISQKRCSEFNLEFPALHVVTGQGLENHFSAIKNILNESTKNKKESIYIGSWAFHPSVRTQKKMIKLSYDISVAMLVNYCRTYKVDNGFTFAALRLKVETFHKFMGLTPLQHNNQPLPSFEYKDFFNENLSASFLDTKHFSDQANLIADFYLKDWENRIAIHENQEIKKVA